MWRQPSVTGPYCMFWSCPSLVNFWSSIFDCLSVLCNTHLKPNPLTALFGVTPSEIYTTNKQKRAIAFCSLITRRVILMNWKSNKCPPFRRWIQEVLSLLQLEKIRHTLNGFFLFFYFFFYFYLC